MLKCRFYYQIAITDVICRWRFLKQNEETKERGLQRAVLGVVVVLEEVVVVVVFSLSTTPPHQEQGLFLATPSNRGGVRWRCVCVASRGPRWRADGVAFLEITPKNRSQLYCSSVPDLPVSKRLISIIFIF